MASSDGDGWVDCTCGARHWGKHGAAGILIVDASQESVLMQLRAEWTHGGRTWGIPGGARDSHETVVEAALRELHEELGILSDFVEVIHHDVWTDHGPWTYHTVIALANQELDIVANEESVEARWVLLDSVVDLDLHPALALVWPEIRIQVSAAIAQRAAT